MVLTSTSIEKRVPTVKKAAHVRVLVIDDDIETIELIRIILEQKSFEVFTTNSARCGLEMVQENDPEVIVVDLLMPEMDGLTICKEIRKISQAPILMLSAVNRPGIISEALEVGADDYLNKPMKSSLLVAHLNKLARRERFSQPAPALGLNDGENAV